MPKTYALLLLFAFSISTPAAAEMCTIDAVPAATLLLPYFEVDLGGPPGMTTLLSINNATSEPALAHVVLWTDWAIPTRSFEVFLTGYDVVTINLTDVFISGNIPITADDPNDPSDTISPHGNPQWDGEFPSCGAIFPTYSNPFFMGNDLTDLQAAHTGAAVVSAGGCQGAAHGDGHARGYVTIDSTSSCTAATLVADPEPMYFVDGGLGIANDNNVLWGDYFYADESTGLTAAMPLVHIEADPSFNAMSTETGYTFYGRYIEPRIGADNREPLGTVWATRYLNGIVGPLSFDTNFIVWRDTVSPSGGAVSCLSDPAWHPLTHVEFFCYDEEENGTEMDPVLSDFPLATQRETAEALLVPDPFGWCRLDLNLCEPPCSESGFGPDGHVAQSYVTVVHTVSGSVLSGGLPAIELANACSNPEYGLIFADGFESGDLSRWS